MPSRRIEGGKADSGAQHDTVGTYVFIEGERAQKHGLSCSRKNYVHRCQKRLGYAWRLGGSALKSLLLIRRCMRPPRHNSIKVNQHDLAVASSETDEREWHLGKWTVVVVADALAR
jgi:hypothetical protein